jgi:hypothetical protein
MRVGSAVLAKDIFARDSMVSLAIPLNIRLSGELRRVLCRVVQHTAGGYQLNSKWGLLNHRYPHSELNGVDEDNGEVSHLTVQEAKKSKKVTLNEVVSKMNSREPIRATQRAGRKRRQGQRGHQEMDPMDTIEVEVEEEIEGEIEGPVTRRRRINIEEERGCPSPSIRAVRIRRSGRRGRQ